MDLEENSKVKTIESDNADCTLNNNLSLKNLRRSVTWNEMYEVGVIGLIDPDEVVCGSNSPTPPKSPNILLESSPEKFDSPDSIVYQEKKRLKKCRKYLTNSSPMAGSDDESLFDILSDEILLHIFSFVPKYVLATLSLVCKKFYKLCLDDTLWPRVDLSFKTLPPCTLGYVLSRGVRALRLNSSAVTKPVFDPAQHFEDDYIFRIEYLDLSAVHIAVQDLEKLLSKCRHLKKLSVEACELSDEVCKQIARNKTLDTLDMAMCTELTFDGLHSISVSCTKLENINISWCSLSPDAVEDFCRNVSPTLLTLNLAGSLRSLNNEDVETLVSRCTELTELDISDCIKINGQVIEYLVKGADNLQALSISRSYKITASNVLHLKGKPSLCTLNIFGNTNGNMYPDDHMKYLKNALPGVTINSEMMSSIARPTVGIRRTSIWGIRCRD